MTTDFKELLDSLARTRADFEARLAAIPAWGALRALDRQAADAPVLTAEEAQRRRAELTEVLKGSHVYQGWLEISAAMAKLAVGAARSVPGAEIVPPPPPEKPAVPLPPDDLLRIRGITQAHAVALHRLGVRRFADIAAWTSAEVARVASALGLGDAISRQNWIEQAALRAPEAVRAAAVAQVATATARVMPEAKAEAKPEAVASAPPSVVVATAPAAPPAVEVAADDLTRIRGIRPALADELKKLGVTRFVDIANWTAADVERVATALGLGDQISRQSWIEQAAMRVPAGALRVSAPVSRAPVREKPAAAKAAEPVLESAPQRAAAPAAKVEARDADAADDLTQIRGIAPRLMKRLNVIGVTRFEHIANWSSADVQRIAAVLELGDQIGRQGWIEQAAMRHLRRGGTLKAPVPVLAQPKPAPVPKTIVQAEREPEPKPVATAKPEAVAAVADAALAAAAAVTARGSTAPPVATAAPQSFSSALAAIRAELTTPLPVAAVLAPLPPLPDQLTEIDGIDGDIAMKLGEHGVDRFATIAGWTAADVARISTTLGLGDALGRKGIIEQAAILARGGKTAFAQALAAGLPKTVPYPPPPLAAMPLPVPRPPVTAPVARPATATSVAPPPVPQPKPQPAQQAMPPASSPPSPEAARAPAVAAAIAAALRTSSPGQPPPVPAAAEPLRAAVPSPSWPSMVSQQPVPVPPRATPPPAPPRAAQAAPPPPVDVNALPGPAEFAPVSPPPRAATAPLSEAPPLPPATSRAMESGLAAALAAAAATASAVPRLKPGHLGEQIRELPAAAVDPYLEDLSDWVQDAAADLPPAPGPWEGEAGRHAAHDGGEAEVSILRPEGPHDLGSVTPGADLPFDAGSYAGYRHEVQEASVEIVSSPGAVRPGELIAPANVPETDTAKRGLRRLLKAFRGGPQES